MEHAPHRYRVVASIVTYASNPEALGEAIASLKVQGEDTHLYLVDNHSPHGYRQVLSEFEGEGVTLLEAPRNGGFGYGHNVAWMQASDSDYVLVMNPDVVLHDGCLAALIAFMERTPSAGLVVPKVFYPDGTLQPLNKRLPSVLDLALRLLLPPALASIGPIRHRLERYSMLDRGYDTAYPLPFASGCCMLFRRDILRRLGGFDEKFFLYFEDADITRRVNELAESWYCPDAHITHHWQRESRSSLKLLWVMLKSAARYFAKWGIKWW